MNQLDYKKEILFRRLVIAVWGTLIFYVPILYYLKFNIGVYCLLTGITILTPLTLHLHKKGFLNFSKILFISSGVFYILVCDSSSSYKAQAQVHFFSMLLLTVLLFDFKNKKSIASCLLIISSGWVVTNFGSSYIPSSILNPDLPIDFLAKLHFVIAFALCFIFASIFVKTITSLEDELSEKEIEKLQIAEEALKMKDLLERTQEDAEIGSWSLDFASNQLTWSEQTYRIHEVDIGAEVDVAGAINFYHPDERDRISNLVDRGIKHGEPWDSEFRFITAKGNHLWVRAIGRIVFAEDGSPLKAEGSFQNVTAKKKAEKAKDTFLATMSHEMRTPLTAIIGMSELLETTELSHEQQDYSKAIRKGGNALLTIINDVLDLSKLSNQSLSLKVKQDNLYQSVSEIIDLLTINASKKELKLTLQYDCPFQHYRFDAIRIRQILYNLVGNSIKFTDKGQINVRLSSPTDYEVVFEVSDTGKGIKKEVLPLIFKAFAQDDTNKESIEGTGLGLSITQKLVHLMNGDIQVESQYLKGTTFKFTLPLSPVEADHIHQDQEQTQYTAVSLESLKVLVVDDVELNRQLVKRLLAKQGSQVTLLENGQKALDHYKKHHQEIDLIIMDIQMPVLDGLSATKIIRIFEKNNQLSEVPIIAFSAFAFAEDYEKSLQAGCTLHLAKPVKKKNLINTIQEAMRKTAQKKDAA